MKTPYTGTFGLACALASIVLAAALPCSAVRLDPSGLGQALIYPYYTTRAPGGSEWIFLTSLVNTRAKPKVVKLRVREGRHARIAFEANVYLGPYDMWTGAIVAAASGSANAARILTNDVSCTDPPIPTGGIELSAAAFTGLSADGAGTDADRTREGFLEAIEMGTLSGATAAAVAASSSLVPFNCGAVVGPGKARSIEAPEGGLSGTGYLINVNTTLTSTYDAIALADLTQDAFYSDVGAPGTDFDSPQVVALSVVSVPASEATGFGASSQGYLLRSTWARGVDAVSAVLMRSELTNEFVMDDATRSTTDWIVTLPTARFYTDGATATAPFTSRFSATGACEPTSIATRSREQQIPYALTCTVYNFDECPHPDSPAPVCWASNALSWIYLRDRSQFDWGAGSSSLFFGSTSLAAYHFTQGLTMHGFATMAMDSVPGHALTSLPGSTAIDLATGNVIAGAHRFAGLPAVGFAAFSFVNGNLTCGGQVCKGSYGTHFSHRGTQRVSRLAP